MVHVKMNYLGSIGVAMLPTKTRERGGNGYNLPSERPSPGTAAPSCRVISCSLAVRHLARVRVCA